MENELKITGGGIDDVGHYRCFFCDGIVILEGSDDAEDVYPDIDDAENATVYYGHCIGCGCEYEMVYYHKKAEVLMKERLNERKELLCQNDASK